MAFSLLLLFKVFVEKAMKGRYIFNPYFATIYRMYFKLGRAKVHRKRKLYTAVRTLE